MRSIRELREEIVAKGISLVKFYDSGESGVAANGFICVKEPAPFIVVSGLNDDDLVRIPTDVIGIGARRFLIETLRLDEDEVEYLKLTPSEQAVERDLRNFLDNFTIPLLVEKKLVCDGRVLTPALYPKEAARLAARFATAYNVSPSSEETRRAWDALMAALTGVKR